MGNTQYKRHMTRAKRAGYTDAKPLKTNTMWLEKEQKDEMT